MKKKPMTKVLFAWIGGTDCNAPKNSQKDADDIGPIAHTLECEKFKFDKVCLIDDRPKMSAEFREWLTKRLGSRCPKVLHYPVEMAKGPAHYAEIREKTVAAIQEYADVEAGENCERFYLISSGSPAMQAIWILVASTSHPGKMLESSLQRGVQNVDIPYRIAAEYSPKFQIDPGVEEKYQRLNPEQKSRLEKTFAEIVGESPAIRETIVAAQKLALSFSTTMPIMILGESGTGKELFATAIASASKHDGQFIPKNCAAIPETLFESEVFGYEKGAFTGAKTPHPGALKSAGHGTLFLDEFAELSVYLQAKFLRVFQNQEYQPVGGNEPKECECGIILATNRDLVGLICKGEFREDLYYRIMEGVITLPPLRERKGDIRLLADFFLERANNSIVTNPLVDPKEFSPDAINMLLNYHWPGNVRQLERTIGAAVRHGDGLTIEPAHLESYLLSGLHREDLLSRPLDGSFCLEDVIGEVERHYVERALRQADGNMAKAAELLGKAKHANSLNKYRERFPEIFQIADKKAAK